MRVLILSHGHPALSPGGAERAAYSLFEHLKVSDAVESCVFVARAAAEDIGHSATFGAFRARADEVLVSVPPVDHFTQMSAHYDELKKILTDLVEWHRPDIVHVHHFCYWGIEVFEILSLLGVKVAFTVHEFMALCHRFGQMLKTDGRLCHRASPAECGRCFPDIPAGQFFLRERLMKLHLRHADRIVAPSRFMAQRLVEWGLPPAAVTVIENPASPRLLAFRPEERGTEAEPPATRTRLGYFGQINPFKGVDVLLGAMASLSPSTRAKVHLSIYGANLEVQDADYQERIRGQLASLQDCVSFMGRYDNESVQELMRRCDWIVVPSLWWENSPVVIQEAALAGRPVLCSRLGGMVEKVASGSTGLHFEAGSAADLAGRIEQIVGGLACRPEPAAARRTYGEAVEGHLDLYRELIESPRARRVAGRRFRPRIAQGGNGVPSLRGNAPAAR